MDYSAIQSEREREREREIKPEVIEGHSGASPISLNPILSSPFNRSNFHSHPLSGPPSATSMSGSHEQGEMPPPTEVPMSKEDKLKLERQEEEKLRQKYPQAPQRPGGPGGVSSGAGGGGHSNFLQKRLAKGQKYFDSGDYQMAKQKNRGGAAQNRLVMPVLAQPSTGDTIPTPELVPARKTSIIQPLHDHSQSMHLASDPAHMSAEPGRPIPNPAVTRLAS
eukprot:maker-scaffold422_size175911-snap-gene-0.36 protein:Tk09766 transcript:maker-scaffold422_size175911-snap-gene-0.36-mRNA-1 annotation:"camp-regulated phosphoprotein 19"